MFQDDNHKNLEKMYQHSLCFVGAGSILECLRLKKKLLVVINDKLSENHQAELAVELGGNGYLHYCTCRYERE